MFTPPLTPSTLTVPQSIISTMDGWVRSMSFGCSDSPGDPGVFYAVKRLWEEEEGVEGAGVTPHQTVLWCCLCSKIMGTEALSALSEQVERQAPPIPSSARMSEQ